jgi:type I restriction enzyme S subunit
LLPSLAEQQQIADYLDAKCSEFDAIISDKQKQISTLETYKKSLIYEYVTGKKEV